MNTPLEFVLSGLARPRVSGVRASLAVLAAAANWLQQETGTKRAALLARVPPGPHFSITSPGSPLEPSHGRAFMLQDLQRRGTSSQADFATRQGEEGRA